MSSEKEQPKRLSKDWSLETAKREHIKTCLAAHDDNRRLTARALGMTDRQLYRILKKLELDHG